MHLIKETLTKIYADKELRRKIVPLFMSKPGYGKTNIIEDFMREHKVWKPPFVLSQRMPFEVSGMALVDRKIDKMRYYNFDFIEELKDGDILFIDEVTNSNPVTLNAFLTFLESRVTISGKPLPDIMIVGAGNYEGMTPLTPQIKERFVWYDVNFNYKMWDEYMWNKYAMPSEITKSLSLLITREDYTGYNFCTPRSIDKAVEMILKDVPTPYTNRLHASLNTLVKNILRKEVKLGDDRVLLPNELISWTKLIKELNQVKIQNAQL